jgi:putative addiction module component (TIGR02574 family)
MSVLFEEALKLPEAERRKLADDIYESLDSSADEVYLTPEQEAELARRIENHRLHPGNGIPWEQVLAEALARK